MDKQQCKTEKWRNRHPPLARIWKIRLWSPGCSYVWALRVVYFPLKHSCLYYKKQYEMRLRLRSASMILPVILEQFSIAVSVESNAPLLSFCFIITTLFDCLKKNTCCAFDQSEVRQNQSRLSRTFSPALSTFYMYFVQVLIGSFTTPNWEPL